MSWEFDINYFVLGVFFFTLSFLLLLRGFWCWYFKFNDLLTELKAIRELLERKQ